MMGFLLVLTNALTATIISRQIGSARNETQQTSLQDAPSDKIEDVLRELFDNMSSWKNLRQNDKIYAVDQTLGLFRDRENAAILNSANFYAAKIDALLEGNPPMEAFALYTMVKIAAVMEYDYYNGEDKETVAQEVLGPQLYEINKRLRAQAAI